MNKTTGKTSGSGDRNGAGRKLIRVSSADLAKVKDQTDWERVGRLTDADIDQAIAADADAAPALDDAFWRNAKRFHRPS
jgi:hypothetical protein